MFQQDKVARSTNVEVQQRAVEYFNLGARATDDILVCMYASRAARRVVLASMQTEPALRALHVGVGDLQVSACVATSDAVMFIGALHAATKRLQRVADQPAC